MIDTNYTSGKPEYTRKNMTLHSQQYKAALLPVGVAFSLSLFVGTFYAMCSSYQTHDQISYLTTCIGASLFLSLMIWLIYLAQNNGSTLQRLAKATGVAIAETSLFIALLWFLILNTLVTRPFS